MADLLLSQRIAKDINFLNLRTDDGRSKFDLRLRVIKAQKILVPKAIFNTIDQQDTDLVKEARKNKDFFAKRNQLHLQYSRLPFQSIFIENETGGYLCEDKEGNIHITIFDSSSLVLHTSILVEKHQKEDFGEEFTVGHIKHSVDVHRELGFDYSTIIVAIVLEILLFLNTKNVTKHTYLPNKKENCSVPKPLLPFYSYHVLDIFREKKVFDGLENIKDFINSDKTNTEERRACIVRGHFKTRSTGIFWWSDFVRNKKNIDKGYVDKDYRLNV